MKFFDSKGLEVEILQTDGGYDEAFVYEAQYIDPDIPDSESEVPENELDHLTEKYQEWVSQNEYDKLIDKAETAWEWDR